MAIVPVRLTPGVQTELTPALVQAGYTQTSYIRWREGLPEPIGGWEKYYPYEIGSQIRRLHAWQDLQEFDRLAVGAEDQLSYITSGTLTDITPQRFASTNALRDFSTTNGSRTVTIVDTNLTTGVTIYDSIELRTPISVGGLILKGTYRVVLPLTSNSYTIEAASAATATVANGGSGVNFASTLGSSVITVTLTAHGLSVGDTFPVLVSTTVGGVTIYGLYTVQTVPTANTFTIGTPTVATSTASQNMNSNRMYIVYHFTRGPQTAGGQYGAGLYGDEGYATGTAPAGSAGTPITATDWSLDNWGSFLVASPKGGPIYYWTGDANLGTASFIAEAPTANRGVFVAMPQQQLIAYGASVFGISDPLLVAWCDVGDFTTWNAQTINQAGTFRIPRGSLIVGGRQTAQQALLWTDLSVWSMQYVGPPDVYGFQEIGEGFGLIGQYAHAAMGNLVVWMTPNGFAMFNGGVRGLDCPIWDVVFQNLNRAYVDNIRAGTNALFNEFWFFYPSAASEDGENDSYVKVNIQANAWDYGPMGRSAWIDQSVLGAPIGAQHGTIYQHETGRYADDAGLDAMFETGYFMLDEGSQKVFVDLIWPDFKYNAYDGSAEAAAPIITFKVRDYPQDTPRIYGPYDMTSTKGRINTRMRGRMMAVRVESGVPGSFWRLGNLRLRMAPDGSR